jgi:glycerol-3-phosphate dehydrogenase (NAD(P)+)
MAIVAVYGAGSWGSALAVLLAKAGHQVALIGRHPDHMELLKQHRENARYLPGVVLPSGLQPTTDLTYLNAVLVVE